MKKILIVESRLWLKSLDEVYNISSDIILTFDFALKKHIEDLGGEAYYIDNLCCKKEMQKNNYKASEFFKSWNLDELGTDIFTSQNIPFGFSFRIEIWSEFLYYVRLSANLYKISEFNVKEILLGTDRKIVKDVLHELGLSFTDLDKPVDSGIPKYFFDIHEYMHNALHKKSIRITLRDILVKVLSYSSYVFDRCCYNKSSKFTVFIQNYHPTTKILEKLKNDPGLRVVTPSLVGSKGVGKYFKQRMIPIRGRKSTFKKESEFLLNEFKVKQTSRLVLDNGVDISAGVYGVIEKQISPIMQEALQILSSVIKYVEEQPIHLQVMIANIGLLQTIVDCVLKEKESTSYFIINGLLSHSFCDEGHYATFINSYSESIKMHYFKNADNVLCLGDPRMDTYVNKSKKNINRKLPTISIGASGFNNTDLNSYVAVEFDFIYDILKSFQDLKCDGVELNLKIKVRPNGVLNQYENFVKEYFPNLDVEIVREGTMIDFFETTDLYISIYSQTLFEASCLGIPVIYYKKDKEVMNPPFDEKSELVTVDSMEDLKQAFFDFQDCNKRFDKFLDKSVMEKYVGYLDGGNLDRNLDFIYKLLGTTSTD